MFKSASFNPIYQRYRFIALAVYAAVLLAGLIDWAYSGIDGGSLIRAPEQLRGAVFIAAMALLIGLELTGYGHSSFEAASKPHLLAFALRLLPFAIVFLVSDLKYIRILFLILVLYSYLGVHRWVSYGLALLGITVLLGLSVSNPVLMGILPPAPGTQQGQGQQLPRPENPPLNMGQLIDESMGSVITLFLTLLLASVMAQALQDKQKLEASHWLLQSYAQKVSELAATEERNRLARDIHDSLGHHLAAINIQLEKANAYKVHDAKRAFEAVGHAQRSVQDALKDIRHSVSSLRQESEPFSFETSLSDLIKRMSHSQLEIKLNQAGSSAGFAKLALMTLYRVIQEGLTNVHKHAHASRVNVVVQFDEEKASLVLSDNGQGFDVASWQQTSSESYGLMGLHERLSLVGGTLDVSSRDQETSLVVNIPRHARVPTLTL